MYIPPGALARYQEMARWQGIASPEFALQGLLNRGHRIVIRAQQMDIGEPVTEDVELTQQMSLDHVGNSSVRFAHSVTRSSDRAQVALGLATAVLLDPDGKPTRMPDRARSLVQEGPRPVTPPVAESRPEQTWKRTVQIRPSDLDTLQHVNQSRYVEFCDDTRQLAAAAGAYGSGSERAAGQVTGLALEYLRETHVGHDLECLTWLVDGGEGTLGFELCDAVDGGCVARGRMHVAKE